MFCGEPMTYETLVMYGGELIAIPESTVVGCSCEQNSDRNSLRIPLPSALLTKFRSEKLKNSKDRMKQNKIEGADCTLVKFHCQNFVIGEDGSGILVKFQGHLVSPVGIQFHQNISNYRRDL